MWERRNFQGYFVEKLLEAICFDLGFLERVESLSLVVGS